MNTDFKRNRKIAIFGNSIWILRSKYSISTVNKVTDKRFILKTGFRSVWLDLYKIGENGMEGKDRAEGDVVLLFLNCDI